MITAFENEFQVLYIEIPTLPGLVMWMGKCNSKLKLFIYSLQGLLRQPTLALGFEEAFKEENFSKFFFQFFKILKSYTFLGIPRSWGVHRYPWFQNWFINMARTEVHTHMNCALLYRCIKRLFGILGKEAQ